MYIVIQNTYCYDSGLNAECLDLIQEILRMQEGLGTTLNKTKAMGYIKFVLWYKEP